MMAGAKVTMLASELLKNGYDRIPDILATMQAWMEEHEYKSIQQMQGSMSQQAVKEPAAFERANYMKVLNAYHDSAINSSRCKLRSHDNTKRDALIRRLF